MREVIYRRFTHAKLHKSDNFSIFPDIIFIDGGIGHINAIQSVLDRIDIKIPIFGMVKDKKHRTRGIVTKNGEIDLAYDQEMLIFITSIQNEAHRFAIAYNKKLREKRYTNSILDEIEGIGKKRKAALIRRFGSAEMVLNANIEDLLEVDGISIDIAKKILRQV